MNYRINNDVLAKKEIRFGTMIVDSTCNYALIFSLGFILGILDLLGFSGPMNFILEMDTAESWLLSVVMFLIYFITFETLMQRTIGKFIFKTKVVMEDGSKPKPADIIIRSMCRLIPFDALSFLGEDGRGWHDSMSDTYVVDSVKFDNKIKQLLELNSKKEIETI